jgi:polysaccharide export outer membrane protein
MKRSFVTLILLIAGALPALGQETEREYRLGPRDLVEIKVLEVPELNVERRVSEGGQLSLPILGEIAAGGLTEDQLARRISERLRERYMNIANVSVVIREFANKPVSVLGAVQRPGSLTISGRWTLLQAISAAGGLTERAGERIQILRRKADGQAEVISVTVADLFGNSAETWNLPIIPSDVINIPPRSSVKVYCLGEVNQPAELAFDSDDRISLLSAIAKAGGVTDRASNRILVKRRGPDGADQEQEYNYRRIINGDDPDPRLMADDVVIVLMSFF